jgi:hypothetical protein
VKNVLLQYSKDGLAFQRYGRVKQEGLGDDILSGNSLAIVGLYQSIYGINPLYNRLLLDPHMTSELTGTRLKYRFRDDLLTIGLDSGRYSVEDGMYKVISSATFGVMISGQRLSWFNGNDATMSLQVTADRRLTLQIKIWNADQMEWAQTVGKAVGGFVAGRNTGRSVSLLRYMIHQLKPETDYWVTVGGRPQNAVRSDAEGDLVFTLPANPGAARIGITPNKMP